MATHLVLVTGDLDSAALLATAKQGEGEVVAVSFSTNTSGSYWRDAAASALAAHYQVTYRPVALYEVACLARKVGTFQCLPNQVMTSVTLLTTLALTYEASHVWLPYHAGSGVPTGLLRSLRDVMREVTEYNTSLVAPFLGMGLPMVVICAVGGGVPFQLTHSCTRTGPKHCGVCSECASRKEAFKGAGAEDPTEYLQ